MTTNVYAAKRTIIDRLTQIAATADGNALNTHEVLVLYAFNGALANDTCLYGGGITFEHQGDDDVQDGPNDRLIKEVANIALDILAVRAPDPDDTDMGIRRIDEICEEIVDEIGRIVAREPDIAGGSSRTRVLRGTGDYAPTEQRGTSMVSCWLEVTSYIDPAGWPVT
jgi:hypothetical protein